jgi:hypothetical protein
MLHLPTSLVCYYSHGKYLNKTLKTSSKNPTIEQKNWRGKVRFLAWTYHPWARTIVKIFPFKFGGWEINECLQLDFSENIIHAWIRLKLFVAKTSIHHDNQLPWLHSRSSMPICHNQRWIVLKGIWQKHCSKHNWIVKTIFDLTRMWWLDIIIVVGIQTSFCCTRMELGSPYNYYNYCWWQQACRW